MLTLPINQLAPVSLVRSDRWLRHLLAELQWPSASSGGTSELAKLALLDIQHCADHPLRSNDAERAVQQWSEQCNEGKCFSATSVLSTLAEEYLGWEGNRFEVKPGKLIAWQRLITKVDPTWLVASALFQRMQCGLITDEQITHLTEQDPQGFPTLWHDRPVADNHVHLGGHGGHSLSMLSFCLELSKKPKFTDWPYHADFPLINRHEPKVMGEVSPTDAPHPSWNELACLGNRLAECLLLRFLQNQSYVKTNSALSFTLHWQRPEEWLPKSLDHLINAEQNPAFNTPFGRGVLCHKTAMPTRWLHFCLLLLQINKQIEKQQIDVRFTSLLNAFIHWSNIQRSAMIVTGVGLTQFVEFFNASGRKRPTLDGVNHKTISKQTDTEKQVQREFKVTSDALISKDKTLTYPIEPLIDSLHKSYGNDDVQLAMHFIRSGASALQKRASLKGELRNLQYLLNSPKLHGFGKPKDEYRPISALRGLDVAADENDLRIEVFSPALRVLREGKLSQYATHSPTEKLHFSIHAGEDYSHLLSGMRHIDETVRFCDFQPWDRIGHGLALGVDVEAWAKQQQVAYIPVSELLDNLVWAHHYAIEVVQQVPQLMPALPLLEKSIQQLSKQIHGEEVPCATLFRAWQLRRNCPVKSKHDPKLNHEPWFPDFDEQDTLWCPDSSSNQKDISAFTLWQKHAYPSMDRERKEDVALVKLLPLSQKSVWDTRGYQETKTLEFQLTQIELDLYSAIQDWLIQDYSRMELVFEACPTSNITIGRFQYYHEHPVYRWYPVKQEWLNEKYNRWNLRTGPLKVCVNTDDAGIMPTSIHTEHRLLRDTAKDYYHATGEDADRWIDRLREIGIEAFRR